MKLRCLLGLHRRSAKDRVRDADGRYWSRCRRCGVKMMREGRTGRWLAMNHRDRHARMAPVRALLDRLTGPVMFLLLLASALGLILWLRGPDAPSSSRSPRHAHGEAVQPVR